MTSARVAGGLQLDPDNPWPGLESYDESSREFFSGRPSEAEELTRRILDEPNTVLFGKSGLGKTSLLRAGVFPHLRAKGLLPIFIRLQVRPDAAPLIEQVSLRMFEEFRASGIEHSEKDRGVQTLWEYLHVAGLEFWTAQNRLMRPVFVFDQFEELFTLGRALPAAVAAFREDLADLAENRIPAARASRLEQQPELGRQLDTQAMPYKLVVSLREDFLADLEEWRVTMPSLRRNRMRLLPMGAKQALEAVRNQRTQHLVPERLARDIVAFLSSRTTTISGESSADGPGEAVEPALLSLFCRGVNEHRKGQGKTQFDGELVDRAKGTIVTDFYRDSLSDLPDRVRHFIEEELITEQGFRNSFSVDDALAGGAITRTELGTLIDRHLLRHEHHLGAERVELTHDLLTKAVMIERDRRRRIARVAHDRRQRLRVRAIVAAAVVAVIVLGALTLQAWTARAAADRASALSRSKEIAAIAEATINGDPHLAALFALEGLRRANTFEARSALLDAALYAWPLALLDTQQLRGTPAALALSEDGTHLAVLNSEGHLDLWDVTSRVPVRRWTNDRLPPGAWTVAFSPDGRVIAVAGLTSIDLVAVADGTGKPLSRGTTEIEERRVAFSPDGHWLVSTDAAGTLQLFDYRQERPSGVAVAAENSIGFAVDDNGRIIYVNAKTLAAFALEQKAGAWSTQPIDLSGCMSPQSVSAGPRYFSATWSARACSYSTADLARADTVDDNGEGPTDDIVWSSKGRAFVKVMVSEDLSVNQLDTEGARRGQSHIKGAHPQKDVNDQSRSITVSETARRVALIDEHGLVRIYSLGEYKPFLSRLDGAVAVAPSGEWMALAGPIGPGERAHVSIVPLTAALTSQEQFRPPVPIDVPGVPTDLFATRSSVVAVLPTTPSTTMVFDPSTWRPRFTATGQARSLGSAGDLLLVTSDGPEPSTRVVRTADGTSLAPWQTSTEPGPARLETSVNGNLLVVLQRQPNGANATALVYSADQDQLTLIGRATGLPVDLLTTRARISVTDDGRSVVEEAVRSRLLETVRRRVLVPLNTWPVASTAGSGAAASRSALSESAAPHEFKRPSEDSPIFTVLRRSDGATFGPFRSSGKEHAFSRNGRWLANWGDSDLQVIDLTAGDVAFGVGLNGKIRGIEFAASDTMLQLQFVDEIRPANAQTMLVPLHQDLAERFAAWLAARPLTADERCYGGIADDCGKNRVAPGSRSAHAKN